MCSFRVQSNPPAPVRGWLCSVHKSNSKHNYSEQHAKGKLEKVTSHLVAPCAVSCCCVHHAQALLSCKCAPAEHWAWRRRL